MTAPCDNLVPFVDGELEPPAAAAFRAHLVDCHACRARLADVVALTARLSEIEP